MMTLIKYKYITKQMLLSTLAFALDKICHDLKSKNINAT